MIVFDTRLFDLAAHLQRIPVTHNSVPLPLLHRDQPALRLMPPRRRKFRVSFSGDCTNALRANVHAALHGFGPSRVRPCGTKVPVKQWAQEVANSNFTLAPSGTFPPTFMMYEAMLLGSIPVFVFSPANYTHHRDRERVMRRAEHLTTDDIDRLMPYYVRSLRIRPAPARLVYAFRCHSTRSQDEGFRFSRLGLFVSHPSAANITSAIAQAEPSVLARVAYLERWQRRFTLASTFDYVQAHVARYSSLWV